MTDEPLFWIILTSIFWLLIGWFFWRRWHREAGTGEELLRLRQRYDEREREAAELAATADDQQVRLSAAAEELEAQRRHAGQLAGQLSEHEAATAELQDASDRQRAAVADLEARLSAMQGELDAERSRAAGAADEVSALRTEAESQRAAAAQAAAQSERDAAAVEDLRGRLATAEQAGGESTGLREQLAARDRELEQARFRADEHEQRATALATEVDQHRVRVSEHEATIADLRGRVTAAEAAQAPVAATPAPVAAAAAPAPPATPAPPAAEVPSPRDTSGASGDGDPDDLQKIFGIGPKLSRLLNGKGIYHFRQIAQWDAEDIRRFDEELPEFHGRIQRDRWIEGAREEHLKKYGERL